MYTLHKSLCLMFVTISDIYIVPNVPYTVAITRTPTAVRQEREAHNGT